MLIKNIVYLFVSIVFSMFCYSAELEKGSNYTLDFELEANGKKENRLLIDVKLDGDKDTYFFEFTRVKIPCKLVFNNKNSFTISLSNSKTIPAEALKHIPFVTPAIFIKKDNLFACNGYSYSKFNNCRISLIQKLPLAPSLQKVRDIVEFKFKSKDEITEFDLNYGLMSAGEEKIFDKFGVNLSTILFNKESLQKFSKDISINLLNAIFASRVMFECSPIRFEDLSDINIKENSKEKFSGTFCYNILDEKANVEFLLQQKSAKSRLSFWLISEDKRELIMQKEMSLN
ncbi:MAG: hypothetical protein ACRC37_01305 [Lentisphaeria bacterium]